MPARADLDGIRVVERHGEPGAAGTSLGRGHAGLAAAASARTKRIASAPSAKVFVSTDMLAHGKGQEIHTESNVLPICLRPDVIVKLTRT